MVRTVWPMVIFAALVGCDIAESDFPAAYADAYCDKLRHCDKGNYENTYDDNEDCRDQWADAADAFGDVADLFGQDYDEHQARECVNELRGSSCEDFDEGDFNDECANAVYH